ncbi:MAG: DegT/DnrJ/EryC1/StrS family aminotransferase [Candidatus Bipolaricaulis sp.]|nr:DegT/DnrJ/EryC1/StrS family aminotransferase [Candidatus Bipolaricaulis sp.]
MAIPLARPEVTDGDIAAVVEVLKSDRLALGPKLVGFEEAVAAYVGVRHAVAVNSGTSALHLLVRSLGLGEGDEVITTPFSFIASTNCILFERARPVFVDIDPVTLCIDPQQIETAITPRTKAILAVDVFGHPADWDAIERIAAARGLVLIEDSAEALGTSVNGRHCGSFGRAGIFGFYPNKQITTGEGGVLVTDDASLAGTCRSLADQGRGDGGWLSHVRLGYNFRLDEMSAALGLSQLARIETIVADRARVAGWYLDGLQNVEGVVLPTVLPGVRMSWFVFVVRLSRVFTRSDRDRILGELARHGIGCRNYFQPIHLQPYIRQLLGARKGDFPVTEAVGDRSISLPFYNRLERENVDRVVEALAGAVRRG